MGTYCVPGNGPSALKYRHRVCLSGWVRVEPLAHQQVRGVFKEPMWQPSGTRQMPVLPFHGQMEGRGAMLLILEDVFPLQRYQTIKTLSLNSGTSHRDSETSSWAPWTLVFKRRKRTSLNFTRSLLCGRHLTYLSPHLHKRPGLGSHLADPEPVIPKKLNICRHHTASPRDAGVQNGTFPSSLSQHLSRPQAIKLGVRD